VRLLDRDRTGAEWRELLSLITIKESYLFRAAAQFRALAEVVVPQIVDRRPSRQLRVWSAGCARGEEATTLAIVLAECPHLVGWDWRVLATDVDEAALDEARCGRFGQRAMARVPEHAVDRFFVRRGDRFELDADLRDRIDYQALNLVDEPLRVPGAPHDVVFLRNVLIYFRRHAQRRVALRVASAFANDGWLFLGPTESLWQLCPELESVDLGDCFCYRHRMPQPIDVQPGPSESRFGASTAAARQELEPAPGGKPTRGGASEAQDLLTETRPCSQSEGSPSHGAATQHLPGLEDVVEALSENRVEAARVAVDTAVDRDPEDAVLRAYEGLMHDTANQSEQAVRAYRAALYLDSRLFQVRYFLARCLEGLGSSVRAGSEYRAALAAASDPRSRHLPGSETLELPTAAEVIVACRQALEAFNAER